MNPEQHSPDQPKKLTAEQETKLTGIIVWSIFSFLMPYFGIPLTWLFAKKLGRNEKAFATAMGILPWVLIGRFIEPDSSNVQNVSTQTAVQTTVRQAQASPPSQPVESPSPESAAMPASPKASSSKERFRERFYEVISRQPHSRSSYARQAIQNWEAQGGVELALRYACEDLLEYSGNSEQLAQSAYAANNYTIPLEQLLVHYEAKFSAAEYAGCDGQPRSINQVGEISSLTPHGGSTGILMAEDASARINLREAPSTDIPTRRYGLVGDEVLILDNTIGKDGQNWYKVKFPGSGAVGWIRSDFVQLK